MMRLLFLVLLLWIKTSCSEASNSAWLGNLIAEREGKILNPKVQINTKKEDEFFKTHGMILFYSSLCPHCRRFAPVLKNWALTQRAEILPLSFDNQTLPEFPHFLPATTQWVNDAFQGNVIQYPALFVVNLKTHALYPVGFGAMSSEELNTRMEELQIKVTAFENQGNTL